MAARITCEVYQLELPGSKWGHFLFLFLFEVQFQTFSAIQYVPWP